MAEQDNLLSAEGFALVSPEQVEAALAAMWPEAGGQATHQQEVSPKSRVCLANLIVVGEAGAAGEIMNVLAELSTMYPTKAIVLLDEPGGSPGLRASVSALCHVPQPGDPQVCSEQILLRGSLSGDDLDRTILPLLDSGVPTYAWWTIDPASASDRLTVLRGLARRLVMDAGFSGFAHLRDDRSCLVREIGWYRIEKWRQLVAGLFDTCDAAMAGSIRRVCIEGGSGVNAGLQDAVWLAAFLGGQLDWQPLSAETTSDSATFLLQSSSCQVEVTIAMTRSVSGISAIEIQGGCGTFNVRACGAVPRELRIVLEEPGVCRMPRTVRMTPTSRSAALAGALAGRPVDAAFSRAAPLAAWMATHCSPVGARHSDTA